MMVEIPKMTKGNSGHNFIDYNKSLLRRMRIQLEYLVQ